MLGPTSPFASKPLVLGGYPDTQCAFAGDVMLHETYTSCIKPDGIYEGKTIKASDVIELQRGGTGMCQSGCNRFMQPPLPMSLPGCPLQKGAINPRLCAGICQS